MDRHPIHSAGFVLALLLPLSATFLNPAHASKGAELDWDIGEYVLAYEGGTGWKGINGKETLERVYINPGATAETWKVTANTTHIPIAITFGSTIRWQPESLLKADKDHLDKKGCRDSWIVIQKDDNSLLYERPQVEPGCGGFIHEYEIGRIIVGKWYAWWLRYRVRNREVSEDDRAAWKSSLLSAKIAD